MARAQSRRQGGGLPSPFDLAQGTSTKMESDGGDGVGTPALVGERLYVFTREDDNEVVRCLDANTGNEIWQDKYESKSITGNSSGYQGPRASPTVADGKVVTLGTRGILSCYDAASGNILWRKDDVPNAAPRFYAASSPIVADGLCIVQVNGITAYDIATGEEKWNWNGDGPAYASPVSLTVEGMKVIVAVTDRNLAALNASDGQQLWKTSYTQGRYNATSPVVDGQTIIYAGPTKGMTAMKLKKQGDVLTAKESWRNNDISLMFNTPVLHDGLLLACRDSTHCSASIRTMQIRQLGRRR